MEATGVALDQAALAVLRSRVQHGDRPPRDGDLRGRRARVQPRQPEAARAGAVLRAGPAQGGKRTKTGYSTDASVLEDLRPAHPMIDKLLEWRVYTKLRSTYVEALPDADRRPTAASTRRSTRRSPRPAACRRPTRTSRTSRSGPSSAGDPARVRGGRSDLVLLAADYSQIELRILAHVSGDEHLKDAFARNADIHRETAARSFTSRPRTSPTASGRWPRWSTSGSPTG